MPFSRFFHLCKFLLKEKRAGTREKFTMSAFTAWQMGAGGGKKFGEYLEDLGVVEKKAGGEAVPEDKEMTAEDAVAKAEDILAMARNKPEEGK